MYLFSRHKDVFKKENKTKSKTKLVSQAMFVSFTINCSPETDFSSLQYSWKLKA